MAEIPPVEQNAADDAARYGDTAALAAFLRKYNGYPQLSGRYRYAGFDPADDDGANAKVIIARTNCFDCWVDYKKFKQDMQDQQGVLWE